MYVYLIAIFIIFVLFLYDNGRNNTKLGNIALFILFLVVAGHNGHMNCDYIHYMNFITGKGWSMYGTVEQPADIEIGYIIFAKLIRHVITKDFEYIIFWGLFICIPFAVLVKRYSNNVILSVLLLMILNNGRNLMTFFCAHRQMLAMTLLSIALIICVKKLKFWQFLSSSMCIAAMFVHSTVFFLIPILILLFFIRIDNNRIYYWGAWGSLVISQLVNLSDYFSYWAIVLSQEFEDNRALEHMFDASVDHSIWQYIPFTLIFVIFVHYYHKKDLNNYFLKCLFSAVLLKNLFGFFPHIARSIFFLCILAVIGAIPKPETENEKYKRQTVLYCIVIVMFTFLEYRVLVAFNPAYDYWCLPYNFIWE